MAKRDRIIDLLLGALGAAAFLAADGFVSDTEQISVSAQHGTTSYPDGTRYNASVLRVETWILRRDRPYELWITRGPTRTNYGHRVTIDDFYERPPRIAATDWRPEGVRVRFTTGHEAFVPARMYLGGR